MTSFIDNGDTRITTTAFSRGHTIRANGVVIGTVNIVRRGYRAQSRDPQASMPTRSSLREAINDLLKG